MHCCRRNAALSVSINNEHNFLRIGTRSSKLAQTQTRQFQEVLPKAIRSEIIPIDASGDISEFHNKTSRQLLPLAIHGVDFTGALDQALADGVVDVVVHSLKDIPPAHRWRINAERSRVIIGAYLGPRENPLDVLVSKQFKSMESLPCRAKVGSASIRRQAQLLACRPDLDIINIRGNIDTRIAALERGDVDALILAFAGLKRLGNLLDNNSYQCNPIPASVMLPGVGQGIIAVTCRANDADTISLLKEVDNDKNRISATTERSFLDTIQVISPWNGRPPVAALMNPPVSGDMWQFRALLATPDGSRVLSVSDSIHNDQCNENAALNLGHNVAKDLLSQAGETFLDGYYNQQ